MKNDEIIFLFILAHKPKGLSVRELIQDICHYKLIHYKRLQYLLKKWSTKGLYSYGVSLDLGWITQEGLLKAYMLEDEDDFCIKLEMKIAKLFLTHYEEVIS